MNIATPTNIWVCPLAIAIDLKLYECCYAKLNLEF